jgi:hypothetical protein
VESWCKESEIPKKLSYLKEPGHEKPKEQHEPNLDRLEKTIHTACNTERERE